MWNFIAVFVAGFAAGGAAAWIWLHWWDWRTPSAERAYRTCWRLARHMRLRHAEMKNVWSILDLRGDRMTPLVRAIRKEELTLEQSTEVLDRLRQRLADQDGVVVPFPEYSHGVRRGMVANTPNVGLDAALWDPGVSQPGQHATVEAESEAARTASVHREMIEGERLRREAQMLAVQALAKDPPKSL